MGNRNHKFVAGEYYHCYNRGVDRRDIFLDHADCRYFCSQLHTFNSTESFGELGRYPRTVPDTDSQLVDIVAFCLLPNHYHLLLKCKQDGGVSDLLKKVGGGYTMYFNQKCSRSGSLFQSTFKSKLLTTDQDFRHVYAYVTLNNEVHNLKDPSKYVTYINEQLPEVEDLQSDYPKSAQREAVKIIKELREGFD